LRQEELGKDGNNMAGGKTIVQRAGRQLTRIKGLAGGLLWREEGFTGEKRKNSGNEKGFKRVIANPTVRNRGKRERPTGVEERSWGKSGNMD